MTEAPAPSAETASRPRRRPGLGIQSKLLIMLLAVGVVTSVVVGGVGYLSGRDSLRQAALEQLVTIRELRAEQVEREFASIQLGVRLDSRNASAVQGARAFIDGFAELQASALEPSQDAELLAYYADQFVPAIEERSGLDFAPEAFVPASPAGQYLQYHYTIGRPYDDYDSGLALQDAGDGSAWAQAGAQYGPYFTGLVEELAYEDLLILDRDANVVYSAYKSVDLGVDMSEEPYTSSALTTAFATVMRDGSLDSVVTTDFERYLPSLNIPTAWVVSPVGTATDIIGAIAIQVPITQINAVMTGDQSWEQQGLGQTGEVYLAGPDALMRSESRLLVESPDEYADTVIASGTPAATAERIIKVAGTVQLQPVDFYAVQQAIQGKTGTATAADYTSPDSLVAYAPLQIDGLDWVIVAHMDESEAFAPVAAFSRTLVLATLAILVGFSALSLLLAQVFTRPVERMLAGVKRVAGGDLDSRVPVTSRDEFGDLGNAFNDMAGALRIKQDLIDEQQEENRKLLLTLMPESVARRYQEGEETISEQHDDVAVVFGELVGFGEFARTLTSDEETTRLNELMRGIDEAAREAGVEKIRTLRGGLLVSSGLSQPRVDAIRRVVDFALGVKAVVERFNARYQTSLSIRAGIDSGTVTSGLIARTNLVYDLWGDAVDLAYRLGGAGSEPGIYMTQAVRDRLTDSVLIHDAGTLNIDGVERQIWRLEP